MITWAHVEGVDELERDLVAARRSLSDGLRSGVRKAAEEGADEARATHRFVNRTGRLEGSIAADHIVSTPGGAESDIVVTARYASFVEAGTAPHEIHARRAPNLVFQVDGVWVRTKKVNHPGTKADGFAGRGYQKAERVVEREVDLAAERAADIVNR